MKKTSKPARANLPGRKFIACCIATAMTFSAAAYAAQTARVTKVVHDVKLLPSEAKARPAEVNDSVPQDTGVRTGDQSRSELTFPDLTITRLGSNSIFSYERGGRRVDLGSGSVLLRVPKDSGGGTIQASAVSVAVTGTTLILETTRGGRSKLLVLEGRARLTLVKYPAQKRDVQGGQMLDVPAGATTLPMPTNIDLKRALKEHPLLAGFPPLPSQGLIIATANNPPNEPVYQGQPVAGLPGGPGPGFPVIGLPPGTFGGPGNPGNPNYHPQGGGRGTTPTNPGTPGTPGGKGDTHTSTNPVKRTPPPRGKKPPKQNGPTIY